MRIVALIFFVAVSLGGIATRPALAEAARVSDVGAAASALEEAMLMPELLDVMAREGAAYGGDLDRRFLQGGGGSSWQAEVERIYAPERLGPLFHAAFAAELDQIGVDTAPILAFLGSDLGQKIMRLEVSARDALNDDGVEESARAMAGRLEVEGDGRYKTLRRFVDANHLVDMNVSSALNANVAFLKALSASAGAKTALPDDEILAQVWAQEGEVRGETDSWLMAFGTLAYGPLSDAELELYLAFSETAEGVALNRALFAAYDRLFVTLSGELGGAVGRWMVGTNL
ncbi:DUF2059 domain-containing protein [Frigidibacter sp. RF13]|uniref:DUF2059 domain-containing protein n=1 Tax=Frigidibacter sp. RF13 TaxID=2997340 RepID=UPI00227227B9|nr:DUF2059 domain-containing protein [Frigidibacter sp. RF13]MCY1128016.1 DUF2059 domain-containing protein [Frigidibacter sp. RF13]